MIGLSDFSFSHGAKPILANISVHIAPGEFVAVCGPNGAGKTTLLRALAGLLPGKSVPPRDIAYLPQAARCAWGMTLREVAALGRLPHGDRDSAAIQAALETCGVAALADQRIDRVSGGQARRALLARAFAQAPRALLLDEPVADLDPNAAHAIMDTLAAFARGGGTVVAVLHMLDLACAYANRMVLLEHGRISADGPPASLMAAAARAFDMALEPDLSPRLVPHARKTQDFGREPPVPGAV